MKLEGLFRVRSIPGLLVLTSMFLIPARVTSAQTPALETLGSEFASDFKYLANNTAADGIDIATSPLHVDQAGKLLLSPKFYL